MYSTSMKIYTKTGDKGSSGLFGGERVPKHHPRLEAYGTIDELNSQMGLLTAHWPPVADEIMDIQRMLFSIGTHLASPTQPNSNLEVAMILQLEESIDVMTAELPPLKKFILPGGHHAACTAHIARTICRRTERRVVSLSSIERIDPLVIQYINRLSDWLFTLARHINLKTNTPEVIWN